MFLNRTPLLKKTQSLSPVWYPQDAVWKYCTSKLLWGGGGRNLSAGSFLSPASHWSKWLPRPYQNECPGAHRSNRPNTASPVALSPSYEMMLMYIFNHYIISDSNSIFTTVSSVFADCPAHREVGEFGLVRQISVNHLEVVMWNETQRWVITMLKYQNPFLYSILQL